MVICENEPAELPKDVVRSTTKSEDDISQFNLNLVSIWEKFELGAGAGSSEAGATETGSKKPSSAGVVIEKPSINLKQTLLAFENGAIRTPVDDEDCGDGKPSNGIGSKQQVGSGERPVVKKLSNLNGFFAKQNSQDQNGTAPADPPIKPLVVRRSESLMMRLKKYESRIAGEEVADDDEEENNISDEDEVNNNDNIKNNNKDEDSTSDFTSQSEFGDVEVITTKKQPISSSNGSGKKKSTRVPKKMPSIDLSSLKSQWENGDISKRRNEIEDEVDGSGDNECNGNSPLIEKHEELCRIRQELARKKMGESGPVRNIYENAIKRAQLKEKQQALTRRDSNDLSTLNGFSTTDIQQRLLQNSMSGNSSNKTANLSNGNSEETSSTNETTSSHTPTKDHFQLNLNRKANKLKEKFELGLINNSSHDDSDFSESEDGPALSKLEQIRQEKLEDLSVFRSSQLEAREARNLFKQIDRQISSATGEQRQQPNLVKPRSFVKPKMPSLRTKLAVNEVAKAMPAVSTAPASAPIICEKASITLVPASDLTPATSTTITTTQTKSPSAKTNHHNHQLKVEHQVESKSQQQQPQVEMSKPELQLQLESEPSRSEQLQKAKSPHNQTPASEVPKKQPELQPRQRLSVDQPVICPAKQRVEAPQSQPRLTEHRQRLQQSVSSSPVAGSRREQVPEQSQVQQQRRVEVEQQQSPKQANQVQIRQQQTQKQPELQPRQQRQSENNQAQRLQRPQQPTQAQAQLQQQKLLENQPIRLTNNCKNVNKVKVLQTN